MNRKLLIKDVMTPQPHSIGRDQSANIAKEMMAKYNIRHLPVQFGGKLIGIISDRDVQFALAWSGETDRELKIEDVFMPDPYIVSPDTDLREVALTMASQRYGSALVVENDKLVGIFTTVDACRALAEQLDTD